MPVSKQTADLGRDCPYCGKPIVLPYHVDNAHRDKVRFCSMACYHAYRRATVGAEVRICRRCGVEHRNKHYNYCLACRRIMKDESKPPNPPRLDERSSRVCLRCGVTFYKPTNINATQWSQTKYCSRACFGASQRKPFDTCEACGEPITAAGVSRGQARFCSRKCAADAKANFKPIPYCLVCGDSIPYRRDGKFCSVECFNIWHRGPNHPLYVHGGSIMDHAGSAWQKIANTIRERDKVCQHCGKSPMPGRVLHVHHIIPWTVSFDHSPENLVALCPKCHKRADIAYRMATKVADQVLPRQHNRQSPKNTL